MCSKETLYTYSYYLEASSGAFGFFGALSIIIAYLSYKELRTYYFQAVFFTSIADGLKATVYFVPLSVLHISEVCYICAITTNYMTIASTMWSLFISVVLYQAIFKSMVKVEKSIKLWFVFIFCIMPFVFLLPLITESYGLLSINCTFKENFSGNLWRLGLFYLPGWIMILVSVYAYFIRKNWFWYDMIFTNISGSGKMGHIFHYHLYEINTIDKKSAIRNTEYNFILNFTQD